MASRLGRWLAARWLADMKGEDMANAHPMIHYCPHCGVEHHYATIMDGDTDIKPKPGDVGICAGCYAPFVLGDDSLPRRPTADEIEDINKQLDEIPGLHEALRRQHDIDLGGVL